jgi:hypothetical protein
VIKALKSVPIFIRIKPAMQFNNDPAGDYQKLYDRI